MTRVERMRGRITSGARSALRSDFTRNAGWYTAILLAERIIGVVQTILLSRLLGIEEYGAYGVLFTTLGLANTLIGFQSGLAATVFVSRYLHSEPARVAGAIRSLTRFSIMTAGIAVVALLPFYRHLSVLLYHRGGYETPTLIGILMIAGSIWSGVQDGFAQGFDSFKFLAKTRLLIGVVGLPLTYVASVRLGLTGALWVILAAALAKLAILASHIRALRVRHHIPRSGPSLPLRTLVVDFALPTVGLGVFAGLAHWLGIFLLSRSHGGLSAVAIVNTGISWRGPALLITSSIGSVAIPRFSRYHGQGNPGHSARLRRKVSLLSGAIAAATTVPIMLASPWIMTAYGPGFRAGWIPFSLVVASIIPTAVSNVYIQEMIGAAKMWRQFWIQMPYALLMATSFVIFVPRFGAFGFAVTQLIAALALVGLTLFFVRRADRSNAVGVGLAAASPAAEPIDAH